MPNYKKSQSFNAQEYEPTVRKVRKLISDYFDLNFVNNKQQHIEDYFRKTAEIFAVKAFYIYKKSSENTPLSLERAYPFYKTIFAGKILKKRMLIGSFSSFFFHLFIIFMKAFITSIVTKKSLIKTDCLYLRKKDYYDLGLGEAILSNLKSKNKKILISLFSFKKSINNFEYLNNQKGAVLYSILSILYMIKISPSLVYIFHYNKMPKKIIKRFVFDCFIAIYISMLRPKVITGVLLDKPLYVLIDYFKRQNTKTISLNESFLYPPFRTFDYNHIDIYLGTSIFESQYLNAYGGRIKEIKHISFIRKTLKPNSFGLTSEIKTKIKQYRNVFLACTVQTERELFWYFSVKDLIQFVSGIMNAALEFPNDLFILKEKKNELSLLDKSLIKRLDNTLNIHVERSIKPRLLKYNQFEDLLKITNLCISMNSGSTIIYQSISANIPVIAINDSLPKSYLSNYQIIEMSSEKISQGIKSWLDLNFKDKKKIIDKLKIDIGLGSQDGIIQASQIIDNYL